MPLQVRRDRLVVGDPVAEGGRAAVEEDVEGTLFRRPGPGVRVAAEAVGVDGDVAARELPDPELGEGLVDEPGGRPVGLLPQGADLLAGHPGVHLTVGRQRLRRPGVPMRPGAAAVEHLEGQE